MTDHDTTPAASTWLTDVTAHLGTPYLANPDGIDLGDRTRRHWLWFPAGVNHHLAIDRYTDYTDTRWEVIAGGKTGSVRWYGSSEPTDAQLRALCTLVGLLTDTAATRPSTRQPYSDDIELVASATEQHHIVADRTDAMGHNSCVCGRWWDAAGDNPSWDEHMAAVALDALTADGWRNTTDLCRKLTDLADQMDERSREADAPADGLAMGEFADSLRALASQPAKAEG